MTAREQFAALRRRSEAQLEEKGETLIDRVPELCGATTTAPLQTHAVDPCCGKSLDKILEKLQGSDSWVCPNCGEEWRPKMVGVIRHWEMRPAILVHGKVRRV